MRAETGPNVCMGCLFLSPSLILFFSLLSFLSFSLSLSLSLSLSFSLSFLFHSFSLSHFRPPEAHGGGPLAMGYRVDDTLAFPS